MKNIRPNKEIKGMDSRLFFGVWIKLIPAVLLMLLFSCRKFIDIKPAPNLISTDAVFTNDKTALSAVAGVYIQMRASTNYFTNNAMSVFGGLSADEIYNTATSTSYDPYYNNALISTTASVNTSFWTPAYKNIYTVNAILEGLEKTTALTDSIKKQLTGEMKVVRAFYYFYLVNLFGDVPLVTSSNYELNSVMPRTSAPVVYEQIIHDLKDAQILLKPNYPSNGKARPNRAAATALLARVYLYRLDWSNAEIEATSVLADNYNLVTNLNNVFLASSHETIWEINSPNEGSNTAQGAIYIPSSVTVKPAFAISNSLLNAFEAGDLRKANWLKSNTVGSVVYYYPFKFKMRTATPVSEYNVVLRLAEQYLARAEARAQQNNIAGAQTDLNVIRSRAGLSNTTATDKAGLLAAIAKERSTELFTEWGDRWLNLKRTNQANAILGPIKGSNWQTTDALYPIPYAELQYNVFLIQNPGY